MKNNLLRLYYRFLSIRDKIISIENIMIQYMGKHPKIKNTDKTIDTLINSEYSISRYGDGEFSLIYGKDLKFQPYNSILASKLKKILICKDENILIGIPYIIDNLDFCTSEAAKYWYGYLNLNRKKIYKLLDLDKLYFDSLITRLYMGAKDKHNVKDRFEKIKMIWKNKKIIVIEGDKSRLGVDNNLFEDTLSVERIICPSVDAFSKYDEIFNEVTKIDKSHLILIALGPTATVLAYELNKLGYRALDIGHIDIEYEWFLNKVEHISPVKNKYIGEVVNGDIVEDINDSTYKSQIRKVIL